MQPDVEIQLGQRATVDAVLEVGSVEQQATRRQPCPLSGGVVPRGDGADGQFAVNGARADNVGFLVDGMNPSATRAQ